METTVKIRITDSGDAWIYMHAPYLMALSELIQRWIISIIPAAKTFFDYMDNRPGLDALVPAAARRDIEKKEIEKIKYFFVILRKNIETAKAILINIDGYIAINTAAEQAYDSVAPPCAPPDNNASPAPFFGINIQKINDKEQRQFYFCQLYNLIDILYIANYIPAIDDKINDDILAGDIRRKIVSDIVQHAANYPQFYPAIFKKWTEKTEKQTQKIINLKIRQAYNNITTRDTHDESRTAPAMLRARQAYAAITGGMASLDAIIPTAADGEDTATLSLYNYIADQTTTGISPEADLLLREYIQEHTDDNIDDEPQQEALLTMPDEDEDDAPIIIDIKPPRPRTGRAKRLQSQQAFDFGGGDNNE
jgi:hypothetical protein